MKKITALLLAAVVLTLLVPMPARAAAEARTPNPWEALTVLSPEAPLEKENRPPLAEPWSIQKLCCYDLFFGRRLVISLEDYIRDPDDPWNLELKLLDIPRNSAGLHLNGSNLVVEPAKLDAKWTFIDVIARDQLGREAVLGIQLYTVDLSWLDFLVLAGILAMLWHPRRRWKRDLAEGQCMLCLEMQPVDLQEPPICLELLLPLPPKPTTLYDMLKDDLAEGSGSDIRGECGRQNLDPRQIEEIFDSLWQDLQNYKIRCIRRRDGQILLRFRNHLRETTVLLHKMEQTTTRFITDDWLFKIDVGNAPRLK